MTIETTPASPPPAKPATTSSSNAAAKPAQGAQASTATAEDAKGFLAFLTAADGALDLPVEEDGATAADVVESDAKGQGSKDPMILEADATALAGWVLGVSANANAKPETPPPAGARALTAGAADTDATRGGALVGAGVKAGKSPGKPAATADLQKGQDVSAPGHSSVHLQSRGHDEATQKMLDTQALAAKEALSQPLPTGAKELAPAAALTLLAERRSQEPTQAKPVATDVTYVQPQGSSAPMGMEGVVASQSTVPFEDYVAEQVTYWITQDVQSAELSVDGMGASPVEVSINMQGNEAQVAFRTDELQARTALERASEQLRDSLQSQGVVLTGMSVGTSGGGDASGQGGRRHRPEGRQGQATVIAPVMVDVANRQKPAPGRALDLFV